MAIIKVETCNIICRNYVYITVSCVLIDEVKTKNICSYFYKGRGCFVVRFRPVSRKGGCTVVP
jgi:hypothetical protein